MENRSTQTPVASPAVSRQRQNPAVRRRSAALGGLLFVLALGAAKASDSDSKSRPISESSTPAEIFANMSRSFLPEKARGIHARYVFDLSGPMGGKWWILVDDGAFKMGTGHLDKPDVTIATSDKDWARLAAGSLGGTRAFLTGRLKFNGNRGLAQKLDEFFP